MPFSVLQYKHTVLHLDHYGDCVVLSGKNILYDFVQCHVGVHTCDCGLRVDAKSEIKKLFSVALRR